MLQNHGIGYITGLRNIPGLVSPFGPQIVTPLFVCNILPVFLVISNVIAFPKGKPKDLTGPFSECP